MGVRQTKHILDALIGNDPDLVQAYNDSAVFCNAVDSLVQLLPSMVQGLYSESQKTEAKIKEQIELMRATHYPTTLIYAPHNL